MISHYRSPLLNFKSAQRHIALHCQLVLISTEPLMELGVGTRSNIDNACNKQKNATMIIWRSVPTSPDVLLSLKNCFTNSAPTNCNCWILQPPRLQIPVQSRRLGHIGVCLWHHKQQPYKPPQPSVTPVAGAQKPTCLWGCLGLSLKPPWKVHCTTWCDAFSDEGCK